MAEPLILAYGRGELPEFPAAPDTIVDIVPVDHVVARDRRGAGATRRAGRAPRYFHVSSRRPQPAHLPACSTSSSASYFDQHPFDVGDRGAVRLPDWRFPGARARRAAARHQRARATRSPTALVAHAPRSDRARELARELDRTQRRLDFLRRYLDLYREYAQAELRFIDDATLALHRALDPADRERSASTPRSIDWAALPPRRALPGRHRADAPARRSPRAKRDRGRAAAAQRRLDRAGGVLAVVRHGRHAARRPTSIETYLWMRLPELDPARAARRDRPAAAPPAGYVRPSGATAASFLRAVYRQYAGRRPRTSSTRLADESLDRRTCSNGSRRAAVRRIREHRAAGHRTVLITGAVRPLTRPLAPLFDHDRGRRPRRRRRAACAPATWPAAAGRRVPRRLAAALRRGARLRPAAVATPTPTATPTCRCCARSATRSRSARRPAATGRGRARWPVVDWAEHRARPACRALR